MTQLLLDKVGAGRFVVLALGLLSFHLHLLIVSRGHFSWSDLEGDSLSASLPRKSGAKEDEDCAGAKPSRNVSCGGTGEG